MRKLSRPRLLFVLLAWIALLIAEPAAATITCVAGGAGCTSTSAVNWNFPSSSNTCTGASSPFTQVYTPTAGNTIFVMAQMFGFSVDPTVTLTDSKSDTCSTIQHVAGVIWADTYVFMCVNVTGGSTTFNINTTGGTGTCSGSASLIEVSGLGNAPTKDATGTHTNQSATSAPDTGTSGTTATANEILLGDVAAGNAGTAITISSGPTNSFSSVGAVAFPSSVTKTFNLSAYEIVSSTGTFSTAWGTSGGTANADGGLVSVQAASTPSPTATATSTPAPTNTPTPTPTATATPSANLRPLYLGRKPGIQVWGPN